MSAAVDLTAGQTRMHVYTISLILFQATRASCISRFDVRGVSAGRVASTRILDGWRVRARALKISVHNTTAAAAAAAITTAARTATAAAAAATRKTTNNNSNNSDIIHDTSPLRQFPHARSAHLSPPYWQWPFRNFGGQPCCSWCCSPIGQHRSQELAKRHRQPREHQAGT